MRIAVLDDYQKVAPSYGNWGSLGDDVSLIGFDSHFPDEERLVAAISECEVVVAMRERTAFTASTFARLPNLKLLVTTGPRNAAIDLAAASSAGVVVSGTGGTGHPTAELTWGLILAVLRHIPEEDANLRAGGWQRTVGGSLAGRTLGIVGLGHLGRQVAAVGNAFRMNVVAWSQNLTAERASAVGAELVTKETLFRLADVVTVHLVLSDRTRHLIGETELRSMRPSAVLINTSRGPIVDIDALVTALHSGWIAGAGIDVYEIEPLARDHPLRGAPNTVLTPHIGYVTDDTYRVFYDEIVEDIAAWRRGSPIRILTA
jgi:phosphoglycerate dehydrogenase-like enzyme